ncbi:capsule biosynthesis protein [Acinetobacter faecalis]|uniref:capsule biosynthesis protein n=1 Tax=Acinetobacter faecalis TaxID=2665161 RepID=UPI002A9200DD|nr:capsular biosynthesis protein [Acinetobacter faecalis]MDY6530932.1 capsular biosynthesis protein [Acinetobacter faecalis]
MPAHIESLLLSKRVLLLQGPLGGFFTRLAKWLHGYGIETYKLNFNGGDWFYFHSKKNVYSYRGRVSQFSQWLKKFIEVHKIDSVVCFGDCRKYHRIANQIAEKMGLKFFAFEEGYIRPNYITFEQDGVNFFSNFSQHMQQVKIGKKKLPIDPFVDVQNSFSKMVVDAVMYYLMWVLCMAIYPHYKHHRGMSPLLEIFYWFVSVYRWIKNAFVEKKTINHFLINQDKKYYVFALQVHNDFQIRVHSDLKNVECYIEKVIESFSQHADKNLHLVIKHHPMDRGYRNYARLIQQCENRFSVEGRVHYYCDVHLPNLLKHSLGMVTVNSTTGIQALYHGIPVKVLGKALYNLPELTYQGSLADFWEKPGLVDSLYFSYFRHELIKYSQLNGAYYGLFPWGEGKR